MVKSRKQASTVVTAIPASCPQDVPVVSALVEETIPDRAPEPVPSSPPAADGDDDASRPVRVYADGRADEQRTTQSLTRLCLAISLLTAGIFDLFHFGHAKALEQAKRL